MKHLLWIVLLCTFHVVAIAPAYANPPATGSLPNSSTVTADPAPSGAGPRSTPSSSPIAPPDAPRFFTPGDDTLKFQSAEEAARRFAGQQGTNLLTDAPSALMDVLFGLFGVIGTLAAIYGGYLMVFSGGDGKKLQQGFQMLIYTAIGMIIAGSAWFVVRFILNIRF